ncbi:hypothetical protein Val02_11060 [Virgisporangium aliadipatigenens]|uniref:MmcQ/YjbR family DNA-binding protein n=1 Tax=Virgisporangium aliadipatigenens TaxID=741659 RepID=A0A8J3YHS3_9ACTN|nr:MmcQ/YjbR family DNA-binding protein [Virgisporangium aliadipatigenens]GIJ44220.1 hypothetical protein Val02_11060 [Virgisporangium aliadipatigenens]
MASWEDVREIGLGLPETEETESREGNRVLTVRGKGFVWERPLRRADLAALGDAAPAGPVLCAHVPDVGAKEALIADDPATFFTTPHFNGFPAVLVRLDVITLDELREVTVEAWLAKAPKRLAKTYLDGAG